MKSHDGSWWRMDSCIMLGWWLLVALMGLPACQPPDVAPRRTTVVRIAGSSAMQLVLYELTAAFTHQHPSVLFEVAGGGSTTGEERVLASQVDLAASTLISSTVPTTARRTPIGLDGLAIVVHATNPITTITMPQLQALYNGRSFHWEEVGSSAGEVLLISREDGSGSRQLFEARVMGEEQVALTAVVMPTSGDVVDYVAKHPNAIGYVSRAYVLAVIDQTPSPATGAATPDAASDPLGVKVLALDGQLPTAQAIQTQSYPLIQPLYLVSRTRPTGWLQQWIDFTLSPAGQAIVARYHGRVR